MKLGIVGLPNVGRVPFNSLTKLERSQQTIRSVR